MVGSGANPPGGRHPQAGGVSGCTCEADWCTDIGSMALFTTGGLDNKVHLSRILDVLLVLWVEACAPTRKRRSFPSLLNDTSETNSE